MKITEKHCESSLGYYKSTLPQCHGRKPAARNGCFSAITDCYSLANYND
jgi:hypothetical protein